MSLFDLNGPFVQSDFSLNPRIMFRRFILILVAVAFMLPAIKAQNVNLQVEVIGLYRTNYSDCFGCGNPDPTWEITGDHNAGASGESTVCWSYEEMPGTFWDLTISDPDCGGVCSDYIIDASNVSATNFTANMFDAYEKNCNNDNCTFQDWGFAVCFPSVYGDSRRTNDDLLVNFRN